MGGGGGGGGEGKEYQQDWNITSLITCQTLIKDPSAKNN